MKKRRHDSGPIHIWLRLEIIKILSVLRSVTRKEEAGVEVNSKKEVMTPGPIHIHYMVKTKKKFLSSIQMSK